MNDKELNNIFAFGIIACIVFTAGNVGLFHFTLGNQLQGQISDAKLETTYLELEYAMLESEYYRLEHVYLSNLFDGTYFDKLHVFKDEYLGETHVAVSIYWSKSDSKALQWAVDHGQWIIGRGDFILTDSLNLGEAHDGLVLQDLRLRLGGITISTRAPWYNESTPWYNPSGEEINMTTGMPINQTRGP